MAKLTLNRLFKHSPCPSCKQSLTDTLIDDIGTSGLEKSGKSIFIHWFKCSFCGSTIAQSFDNEFDEEKENQRYEHGI